MKHLFRTDSLNLAVYLHASKLLPYVGIKRVNSFKMEFVFEDADHKADEIEMNYESGASLPVNAVLASLRFLRKAMNATPNEIEYRGSSNDTDTVSHRNVTA